MEGLLKVFSCKEFADDDDVTIQKNNGEDEDTKELLASIINTNLMKKEECFDSYIYLLLQLDYIKSEYYEMIVNKLVAFISNNSEILAHDWGKNNPSCCEIAKAKINLTKKLISTEENKELKSQLINRINMNFDCFIKKITLAKSHTMLSKDGKMTKELHIDEFFDEYGNTFEDIINNN